MFVNIDVAPQDRLKYLRERKRRGSAYRHAIGMEPDDLLILQPTRVVARKGIAHSVELVKQLQDRRARLVISHAAGDEGDTYANFLRLFSDLMKEIVPRSPVKGSNWRTPPRWRCGARC